jgi:hypothetical protein
MQILPNFLFFNDLWSAVTIIRKNGDNLIFFATIVYRNWELNYSMGISYGGDEDKRPLRTGVICV